MPSPYDEQSPSVVALREVVAALQDVASVMQDGMGVQRLPGSGTFAFRRMSEVLMLPVAGEASRFDLPQGFFEEGGDGYQSTTFFVVNPNTCFVRLRGSPDEDHRPVTAETGWLFPPHFAAAFSTLYPCSMSTLAVPMPDVPLPSGYAPLHMYYGGGA